MRLEPTPYVRRVSSRAFTLVELMVALTGGLFISVFVFMLASHGSRFYQQEARISNATIGVMNGFQRLRADIARAAFLSSPNIVKDPLVCRDTSGGSGWDSAASLKDLAGIRLIVGGSVADAPDELATFWSDNELTPDQLIIAGSFSSPDQFPVAGMEQLTPNVWTIYLQPNSPAMARLGYRTDSSQTNPTRLTLLQSLFTPDDSKRALRILDRKGSHHYGVIGSVGLQTQNGLTVPFVRLTSDITLKQETNSTSCGLQGLGVGSTVNVVNFIRYGLDRLDDDETYAPIYADAVDGTYEEKRSELVRVELDVDGAVIPNTTELVAEYAIDLKFGLTALNPAGNGSLVSFDQAQSEANLLQYAGAPTGSSALANNRGPHFVRTIHARLAVRSREGDREAGIDADAAEAAGIPGGLYRVALGPEAGAPFARVRTLQADIALRNHMRARWP